MRIDDQRSGGAPVTIGLQEQSGGGTARLRLAPRVDQESSANLSVQRWVDFRGDVLLNIRTDPALVPSARVLEMVASIRMVDDFGAVIASGYDINAEHDIVLAFSGGSAEITHIARDDQGLIITALVRDDAGNVIDPPQGTLALYSTGGEKLCFTEEVISAPEQITQDVYAPASPASIPMTFAVLMDRSGSMAGHMDEMRDAARGFVDALPNRAGCLVGAFSEGTASFDPGEGFGYFQCRARHFPMGGLQAGGGTDLFGSLAHLYDWMNQSALQDHQRAVIIITDGKVNRNLEREASVIAAKGDVVTFVYFLGGDEERFLKSLADSYIGHDGDLRAELPRFFNVVREVYTSQTVLRQTPCGDASTAGAQP
ncbi:VWA domain-containing protein [Celeribacter indicus]|uniref:VWA domain-containing protein n=1 Tax=Celeribacter indicus TaxID=1208324 RepID=UPI00130D6AE2|nr:vWA domain-containing protein [Celeribacter indicus]